MYIYNVTDTYVCIVYLVSFGDFDRLTVGCSLTMGDLQSFLTTKWQLGEKARGSEGTQGKEGGGGGEDEVQPLTLYHSHGSGQSLAHPVAGTGITTDPTCVCSCPKHGKISIPGPSEHKHSNVSSVDGAHILKQKSESGSKNARESSLLVQPSEGQGSEVSVPCTCTCPASTAAKSLPSVAVSDSNSTAVSGTGEDCSTHVGGECGPGQSSVQQQIPQLLSKELVFKHDPPTKLDWSPNTTLSSLHTMV